ncbi:helix-turn-helix domain-containing protein [Haloplasma contractile]|uniref:Transcription regulator Cro-CI family protein n=1 Tax=Haloplasma contractile SSD-17B TaxID=1033810 RepID=F7PWW4_9MOLU|nr:helix-turn-helix transcriptional regulator [Haloplasma contractile]ERJ12509.1 Transcription regulator Cro-CI family protein [Haloplasma contractile SSD-17B]
MNIGLKIKSLRREQNVTQEKLADYLHISYQAVSKWENETASPDISLIVPLANFFGVTTDYLLDNTSNENYAEIEAINDKIASLRNIGKTTEAIKLLSDSLLIYPKEFRFMYLLANMLSGYHSTPEQEKLAKLEKYDEQAVKLCEKILEDCSDEEIRNSAKILLCYQYPKVGKRDKAIELAKKMPSLYATGSLLLASIYDGEEKIKQRQENLKDYLTQSALELLWSISNQNLGNELSNEEKIVYLKDAITIMNTLFYDGNFLFEHIRMFEIYIRLSRLMAETDNLPECLECLKSAKFHALLYDQLPEGDIPYTSRYINRLSFNRKSILTNSENSAITNFKETLKNKCFDKYRDNVEFLDLL